MKLFGKKEEKKSCCCGSCSSEELNSVNIDTNEKGVKVLGSGCKKCNALEENVTEALKELGMDDAIEHVTDFAQIASYGVMSTPALVVDGKVVSFGKVLSKDEAKTILEKVRS